MIYQVVFLTSEARKYLPYKPCPECHNPMSAIQGRIGTPYYWCGPCAKSYGVAYRADGKPPKDAVLVP